MSRLYNGLEIPDSWPPRTEETTLDQPLKAPYLNHVPEVVDITTGRQLFVDDFLIEETNLSRTFHRPVFDDSPVFEPKTNIELNDGYCPCACPFSDGVFYDDKDGYFKMWYSAGFMDGVGYAQSKDGRNWTRLEDLTDDAVLKEGSVIPHRRGFMRDGASVWIDNDAKDSSERFKMSVFYREFPQDIRYYPQKPKHSHDDPNSVRPKESLRLFKSGDGIHWDEVCCSGYGGDNTTFFYNPFRKKWVFSLRTFSKLDSRVRVRGYYETSDFFKGSNWTPNDVVFWNRTDIFDKPDPEMGYYTQLYNLDASPYESLMLGAFSIFMGPPNNIAGKTGLPKINDVKIAFSRDGFHWDRPTHDNFIESSRIKGQWDYGYVHPANGICQIVGDELWFFTSFFSGKSPRFGYHKYAGGSVGLGRMRRDGFASLDGQGFVLTRRMKYKGDCLFANVNGAVWVEVLDGSGHVVPGYSMNDCRPFSGDKTKTMITWKDNDRLPNLEEIKLRFKLDGGSIYSFWIADDVEGHSRGFMAGGSPDAVNGVDAAD